MSKTISWAAPGATSPLERYVFERREPLANDVVIDIEFCGICHSDIHTCRDEWDGTTYPLVPGHEIIGRVREVGADVTGFGIGDRVGVGCMVDSCRTCEACVAGLEQYCHAGCTWTYNSSDSDGGITQGGYSSHIVVRQEFVLRIPESLEPAAAAPILCAGITTYSPLRHFKIGSGSDVAVAGFGGLGAMAVKLAKAMGARVTVLTRSADKAAQARSAGAGAVIDMSNAEAVAAGDRSFDLIISTIPKSHDLSPYLPLLRLDGSYVIVGAIEPMREPFHSGLLLGRRVSVTGSGIGGIQETQELLDFCAEHQIVSDVEVIGVDRINDAYDAVAAGRIGHRYVIDMSTLS